MRDALRRALHHGPRERSRGLEARRLRPERHLGAIHLLEVGLLPVGDAVLAHRHERRELDRALGALLDLLAQGFEVDARIARADHFEHERPAAAEHEDVDVLTARAVEPAGARAECRQHATADQLLDRLLRQLAEALARLAALATTPVALAGRTPEDRLRQAAAQLAVARLEVEVPPRALLGLGGGVFAGRGLHADQIRQTPRPRSSARRRLVHQIWRAAARLAGARRELASRSP